jgi:hypothetical protein
MLPPSYSQLSGFVQTSECEKEGCAADRLAERALGVLVIDRL